MSNHSSTLIGRRFEATVAEPWDFDSEDGDNVLTGTVLEISCDTENFEWIRCRSALFGINRAVSEVAVVSRHRNTEPLLTSLAEGKKVGVNILYDPSGQSLDAQRIQHALRTSAGLSFLAGEIAIVPLM